MIKRKINQTIEIINELANLTYRASLSVAVLIILIAFGVDSIILKCGLFTWTALPYIRFFLNNMGWLRYED